MEYVMEKECGKLLMERKDMKARSCRIERRVRGNITGRMGINLQENSKMINVMGMEYWCFQTTKS